LISSMTILQLEEVITLAKEEIVKRLFDKPITQGSSCLAKESPCLEQEEESDNEEEEDDEPKKITLKLKYLYDESNKEKPQQITIRIVPEFVEELQKKMNVQFITTHEKCNNDTLRNFDWTYSEYKNSKSPIASFPMFRILINTEKAREHLRTIFTQTITSKTLSLWYPKRPSNKDIVNPDIKDEKGLYQSKYPIYIISKGRWEKRLTATALEEMGVNYRIVIEQQEYDNYAQYIAKEKIIVLPTDLPFNGSGIPARNYVWEHSKKEGHKYHWILDDNLDGFYRFNRNKKEKVKSGYIFNHIEQMVEKHTNVMMAGMNYYMFIPEISMNRPIITSNTRIYSCILLKNDIPRLDEHWRGKYNEDTDLSLRLLKLGYSTFLFNNYLCNKATTLTMKGGNAEIYAGTGVEAKLNSLIQQHPDVVKATTKYKRPHHQVNYKPFKDNIYIE